MRYSYYAIFTKSSEGGYDVTFPDIFGGVTCGDNLEDAKYMAKDLLKIMLSSAKGQCFPPKDKKSISDIAPKDSLIIKITVNI